MRSGRPMLVMPCTWDQPDNAERVARLGISRTIPRRCYTAARVAAELRRLLDDPAYERAPRRYVSRSDERTACGSLAMRWENCFSRAGLCWGVWLAEPLAAFDHRGVTVFCGLIDRLMDRHRLPLRAWGVGARPCPGAAPPRPPISWRWHRDWQGRLFRADLSSLELSTPDVRSFAIRTTGLPADSGPWTAVHSGA